MVGALRELPSVRLTELPRMADFARFGEALGRGLRWPAGAFLGSYLEGRRDATIATIDDSVFGTFLLERLKYWDETESRTQSPREWLASFDRYTEVKATKS